MSGEQPPVPPVSGRAQFVVGPGPEDLAAPEKVAAQADATAVPAEAMAMTPGASGGRPPPGSPKPKSMSSPAVPANDGDDALLWAGRGQRILVMAFALSLLVRGLGNNLTQVSPWLVSALAIGVLCYACKGILAISSGFGYGRRTKLALMVLTTVPVLGILSWFVLSIKTTRALRAAGYPVGLFGLRSQ
jgi:hypothetical protein